MTFAPNQSFSNDIIPGIRASGTYKYQGNKIEWIDSEKIKLTGEGENKSRACYATKKKSVINW